MQSEQSFPARGDRYYEDYRPGLVFEFGSTCVSESDIVDFASRFDPQPIHTDSDLASHGPFKGLIASGWHTVAIMFRLFVDHYLSSIASLGSPGVDELRWKQPVRPGDTLSIRATILDARRSRSKVDRGVVTTLVEVLNQRQEVVMSLKVMNLLVARSATSQ